MDNIDEQKCKTLCIPRTDINISESFVRNIFNNLNIGIIGRIDLVRKQNEKGGYYMRIFIHINKWYNTDNANIAKQRLLNGKDIKIIYDVFDGLRRAGAMNSKIIVFSMKSQDPNRWILKYIRRSVNSRNTVYG